MSVSGISRRVFLAMAGASPWLPGCSETSGPSLRLGCNSWPGYAPLFLARERRDFSAEAVKLVEFPSTTEVLRAFGNGLLEAAAITLDEALLLREKGIEVAIVLITDFSLGGDAILARPPATSLADMKGGRIGVEGTALGAYLLARALDALALGPDDFQVLQVSVDEQEKAFEEGRIDAIVTFEPVRSRLLRQGATEVFSSRAIPGEIVDVVVVRADVLDRQPGKVRALVDGWYRALDAFQGDEAGGRARTAPRLGLTPWELAGALEGLRMPGRAEVVRMLEGGAKSLEPTLVRLHDLMVWKGLLAKPLALGGMLDPRFARGEV